MAVLVKLWYTLIPSHTRMFGSEIGGSNAYSQAVC